MIKDRWVLNDTSCDELLAGAVTAVAWNQTTANVRVFTVQMPMQVVRFGIVITTATAGYTTPPRVALFRRVTFGSDTGRVKIAEFNIPTGLAAGTVYYVTVKTADARGTCLAGSQLVVATTVQGSGGASQAGAYRPFIEYALASEATANQTSMVRATDLA